MHENISETPNPCDDLPHINTMLPVEVRNVSGIIKELDSEADECDGQIVALMKRRDALRTRSKHWRSFLAGRQSLPPEVLCRIFELAVWRYSVEMNEPTKVRKCQRMNAVLPITHVCRSWREAAIGSSMLWSTIQVSRSSSRLIGDQISAYLERSRDYPIDIYLFLPELALVDDKKELDYLKIVPSLLFACCYRWRSFAMNADFDSPVSPLLSYSPKPMPKFHSLDLQLFGLVPEKNINLFRDATSLKTVEMGYFPVDLVELEWPKISEYRSDQADSVLKLMSDSALLKSVTFYVYDGSDHRLPEDRTIVHNSNVESLTIRGQDFSEVFKVVRLSRLKHLTISDFDSDLLKLSDFEPPSAFFSSHLQTLNMSCDASEGFGDLIDIMSCSSMAYLHTLKIEQLTPRGFSVTKCEPTLISTLVLHREDNKWVLPRLKHLEFTLQSKDIDDCYTDTLFLPTLENQIDLVLFSRHRLDSFGNTPSYVERLASFSCCLHGYGNYLSKRFEASLDRFRKEGMAVEIKMLDNEAFKPIDIWYNNDLDCPDVNYEDW